MGAASSAVRTEERREWLVRELASVRRDTDAIVEVEPGLFEFNDGFDCRLVGWEGDYAIMRDEPEMDVRLPWAWWPGDGVWSQGFVTETEAREDARADAAEEAASAARDAVE